MIQFQKQWVWLTGLLAFSIASLAQPPSNNPVAGYGIEWCNRFAWKQVITIHEAKGKSLTEKLENAQISLTKNGGGVIYFPAGEYVFENHILLKSGIVLRGTDPINSEKHNPVVPHEFPRPFIDAREPRYSLGTVFHFPKYVPSFTGEGTPISTAFKGIRTENPADADYIGIVNIDIRNGHIALGEKEVMQENYSEGRMLGHFLVFGNVLVNTAVAGTQIPQSFQHPWQRWTDNHYGAITLFAAQNVLVANNRIPAYNHDNFLMKGYNVYPSYEDLSNKSNLTTHDVWFDYENRTGIRVNFIPVMHQLSIWDKHPALEQAVREGTHEKMVSPGTLAKGIVIRNNYIYTSGNGGIKTSGDGAVIAFNVIRCRPSVVLPTSNGLHMGSHVNNVRGIEVRGWRWTIEGNDYEVHSNYTPEGIKYNDGEGIMHESWENVGVRDSRIINNVGNRYVCLWRIPVRGLLIQGNRLRIKQNWHAIFVNSQSRPSPDNLIDLPCQDVVISNNITEGSGIKTLGMDGTGNSIVNNRHTLFYEGKIEDHIHSRVEDNVGYMMESFD